MLASLVGWAKAESKIVPTPQRPGRLCPPYKPPDERIPSQHTNHTLAADAEVAGRAMHFSARMRTKILSPTGVLSDGCARASTSHPPILTRESGGPPRTP